jgi:hypothetical protein
MSPDLLDEMKVPVQMVFQKAGEIIIVWPDTHHTGFNTGYNISESNHFASESWIPFGKSHKPCECAAKVSATFDMGQLIRALPKWKKNKIRNITLANSTSTKVSQASFLCRKSGKLYP